MSLCSVVSTIPKVQFTCINQLCLINPCRWVYAWWPIDNLTLSEMWFCLNNLGNLESTELGASFAIEGGGIVPGGFEVEFLVNRDGVCDYFQMILQDLL